MADNIISSSGYSTDTSATYYMDPATARRQAAGLPAGGRRNSSSALNPSTVTFGGAQGAGKDWRVKISCPALGYPGIMSPLGNTNGVVFPYTPQVSVVYQANYTPQKFTHSNYPAYAYENSEVQAINVTADFTAQNMEEAKYVLACIYFFRSATKMFFGESSNAGNPPPLVFLDGYGQNYFPHVPCILTQFSHTMPPEVDYISSGTDRIPAASQITISLQPIYSKKSISSFSLESFAAGKLTGKGFI
jgi:hypothetical protein